MSAWAAGLSYGSTRISTFLSVARLSSHLSPEVIEATAGVGLTVDEDAFATGDPADDQPLGRQRHTGRERRGKCVIVTASKHPPQRILAERERRVGHLLGDPEDGGVDLDADTARPRDVP